MEELLLKLKEEYSWCKNPRFTDIPEERDFPILFTTRKCQEGVFELTFFGYRDAKYLLSLKGIHVA